MSAEVFVTAENRPAQHDKCVFFGVDEGYFPFALLVAEQIHNAHPDRDFDICIVSQDELLEHDLVDRIGIRTVAMNMDALKGKVRVSKRLSLVAYLGIAFVSVAAEAYKRLLFLDADLLYLKGDLSRLLNLDLGPHAIGAVRDNLQWRNPERDVPEFSIAQLPQAKYCNTGVVLYDARQFAEQQILQKVVDAFAQFGDALPLHDQSLLNVALHNNWAELSMVWNCQHDFRNVFPLALSDPHIMHFIGPTKPWHAKPFSFVPKKHTRKYSIFLSEHFPQLAEHVPDGLQLAQNAKEFRFGAIVNLFNVLRVLPQLERDFDPWTVRGPDEV